MHRTISTLLLDFLESQFSEARTCTIKKGIDDGECLQMPHLLWMLHKVLDMEDEQKAHRWIGYVQGVLVCEYECTLDEMRSLTKEAYL